MGPKWLRKFLMISHFSHWLKRCHKKLKLREGRKPLQHMPSDALHEGSMSSILLQDLYIAEGATVAHEGF